MFSLTRTHTLISAFWFCEKGKIGDYYSVGGCETATLGKSGEHGAGTGRGWGFGADTLGLEQACTI